MAQAEKVGKDERGTISTSEYTNRKQVRRVSIQMDAVDATKLAAGDKGTIEAIRGQVKLLLGS